MMGGGCVDARRRDNPCPPPRPSVVTSLNDLAQSKKSLVNIDCSFPLSVNLIITVKSNDFQSNSNVIISLILNFTY